MTARTPTTRRRATETTAAVPDPARGASQRRNGKASNPEPPALVLKYDTTPPDPGAVDQLIDTWRRNGWTD